MGHRVCQLPECYEQIPVDAHGNKKYCSAKHRERHKNREAWARRPKRAVADPSPAEPRPIRRGAVYDLLRARPDWTDAYRQGTMSTAQLAALADTTTGSVNLAWEAITQDETQSAAQGDWPGPPEQAQAALSDFRLFRRRYFQTEEGVPYQTTGFHEKWIAAILDAMNHGGRLMILSPPRHGKSSLLLHLCLWVIVRNPHIRIVWVAANRELAEDWTVSLEEELETNQLLIADYLPPGGMFRPPPRSRRAWSRSKFTVATRSRVMKSPTFVAGSRGSRILSRDVDLLIADDIEDHASTLQPYMREQTRNWWSTDIGSRKEPTTTHVVIGSRQHPDDLYGHLLESEAWQSIVETAHSDNCRAGDLDPDTHVDCMLWPDRLDYRWLHGELAASETTGGRALWEMVYLNRPSAKGLDMFNRQAVDRAKDITRGLYDYPSDSILVAGLDPSGSGYQASFLWAFHPQSRRLYMVDTEDEEGGGIQKARGQVARWFDGIPEHPLYCRRWFVESNMYHQGIISDEILSQYCLNNMIELTPHQTGANKWDPHLGVSVMNGWFEANLISLPYRTAAAREKTDGFVRQLRNFAGRSTKGRWRGRSDLVMAAWFPFPHIQYLDHQRLSDVDVQYASSYRGWTDNTMFSYTRRTSQ